MKIKKLLIYIVAGAMAAAFAIIGGYLSDRAVAQFGWTTFLIVPFVTGFLVGSFFKESTAVVATLFWGYVFCALFLIVTAIEGVLCIFLAAPLLVPVSFLGAVAGHGLRMYFFKDNGKPQMALSPVIGILTIIGSAELENRNGATHAVVPVTNSCILNLSQEKAWHAILSMDKVASEKPFLMHIGLPVPKRCVLEKNEIGSRRICYFDAGIIEEIVTTWQPPHRIDMRIIRSTLPGRHWLTFISASYELEKVDANRTKVIRTTTMSSKLRPRWYWRFFESLGVETEHQYLFESLKN